VFDLGFLGVYKDFLEQKSSSPYKRRKNKSLSAEEKEYNRNRAKMRMIVEHTIAEPRNSG
jgi:hypothetical protein